MKVKSIIYMVLALSLCCGCSDWLTVDSKTILSEEDIAKYPELSEAQFLSNYAELRKSIHCIGDGAMSYRQHHLDAFTDDASVVEAMRKEVWLVEGNRENIKLTTPFDLKIAEVLI